MQFQTSWADEQVERLKALWADGKSASEIGREIGVTRNAVIGKVHRLGLSKPKPERNPAPRFNAPKQVINPHAPKRQMTRRAPVPSTPKAAGGLMLKTRRDVPPLVPGQPCSIVDVAGCKWEVTGKPLIVDYRFCNATTEAGHSYCPHHEAMKASPASKTIIKRTVRWALLGAKRSVAR